MKTGGVVAEFNPFHTGHALLLHRAREAGVTHVLAVMSGNFVQRGDLAVTDKRVRAHCALLAGADLVAELSLPHACASAQQFARGAIGLLHGAGCVDTLLFGSESGDTTALSALAGALESPSLGTELRAQLARGITFAKARQLAVARLLGEGPAAGLATPNNALAVEYLRATHRLGWRPELFTIPRQGAAHDAHRPGDAVASASYLRAAAGDHALLRRFMPASCAALLQEAQGAGLYPSGGLGALETAVLARLRLLSPEELALLPDLSEGLENRLHAAIRQAVSLDGLYAQLKTKRYTLARVRRLVLHAFLGITAAAVAAPPPYLRVLGFNRRGRELLAKMADRSSLPVDTKLTRLRAQSPTADRFAALEERATDLYTLSLPRPRPCGFELSASGIYLNH